MSAPLPAKPKLDADRPGWLARWLRRLTWLVVIGAVLVAAVVGADYLWFRLRLPVGFYNANWSGGWQSRVWGLRGRLVVRLPDPLPENEDFKAEALVYYPIYSGWKTGQFVKMDFRGRLDPATRSSGGVTTNPIDGGGKGGGKFTFKATAGNQTVDYVAIMNDRRNAIDGGFVSEQPTDHGVFWIRYY